MIVAFREPDLTIRTVMKAEDSDEILDHFEAIAFSMFKDFDPDDIYDRIARAAMHAVKDHD